MNARKNSNGNKPDDSKSENNVSFNLIDEPWIPVVDQSGKPLLVGLKELFQNAENLADLNVGTVERIALTRLLLCIAQRAINGPKDNDDWKTAGPRIVPESLEYLEHFHDQFDLFGDRPFLQVKKLSSQKPKLTDKLDFGLASGNNATLFDQCATSEGRVHSCSWLIQYLMVFQMFSPGGRIGIATWNDKPTIWEGTSENSPGIEGCMLYAMLKGSNLLRTIHWNMVNKEKLGDVKLGRPIWEFDPNNLTNDDITELTHSYLGHLVPMSRTIVLSENGRDMILANGLIYPRLPDYRETMATVRTAKENKKGKEFPTVQRVVVKMGKIRSCLRCNFENG